MSEMYFLFSITINAVGFFMAILKTNNHVILSRNGKPIATDSSRMESPFSNKIAVLEWNLPSQIKFQY